MTRDEALQLVTDWTSNKNLVKHMLAVEAEMRAFARHFKEDEDLWGITGLLHDADYEMFAGEPKKHPSKIFEEIEGKVSPEVAQAIRSHAWGWQDEAPEPTSQMDWALFTCDDLSGFIIACALVRPDKKLASVTLESIQKKWTSKGFAAGVNREHIALCEEKLNITLEDYLTICLKALQGISSELGL